MVSVYFERQRANLCGQHCLNNLMQGQFFDVSMLGDIASGLDAEERALMMEAGADTPDALRYLAQDSQNVDDSGNFSIQVLRRALSLNAVTLEESTHADHRESMERPHELDGFICNLEHHWFSIRKVHGEWWDLNSLLERPRWVSPTYLSAYLAQLRMQAYDIFVALPAAGRELPGPVLGAAAADRYFDASALRGGSGAAAAAAAAPAEHVWGRGQRLDGGGGGGGAVMDLSGGDGSDAELARVLALSAQEWSSSQGGGMMEEEEDDDNAAELAAALAMSVGGQSAAAAAAVAPPALPTSETELSALPRVKVDFRGEGKALVCPIVRSWCVAQLLASIRADSRCPESVRRCQGPKLYLVEGPRQTLLQDPTATLTECGVGGRARLRISIE
mgnify:CR=1 FL=1|tara:strand:- start:728 stop:1897 length:1170 start_codon:yes stop_codon:yes gene_type:complete